MQCRDKIKRAAFTNKSPLLISLYGHISNTINKLNAPLSNHYMTERRSQATDNMNGVMEDN